MKHLLKKVLVLIVLIFQIYACSSIKTVAPIAKKEIPLFVLKSSYISLPIEIDVKDLEKKINFEIKGLLYADDSFEGDDLKVKAWKKQDFTLSVVGNELFYSVPLKISIKYKKLFEFPEVFADITLKFKTQFSIQKDWTLITKTTPLGFDWVGSEGIKFGGVELPLKTISDMVLNANKDTFGKEIDAAIKTQLDLKGIARSAWSTLNIPIVIKDDPKVWLKMSPAELSTVPIVGKNGKILLTVAVKSTNEIVVNDVQPKYVESKFPELKIVQKLPNELSINLNVDLPFTKLDELASKELVGKNFTSGKKSVLVKSVKTYGSTEFFVIELQVEGSLKGFIYLKGKPHYNASLKTIEIKEVEFDFDTKNKLFKSAEWLLHSNIVKLLEEKLSFPIADKLAEAKKMANDNLKNNQSIKGVVLNGLIDEISIDQIYVMPSGMKAIILLNGKMNVSVNGLSKM